MKLTITYRIKTQIINYFNRKRLIPKPLKPHDFLLQLDFTGPLKIIFEQGSTQSNSKSISIVA